ncbi:cytidine deaminase [Kitasatospora sp. GP82]|uniref:cytidine deaminase family protein n=1 Tax=Kitasatospora sp. GP82 TaxID=3035089 RepID=UPI0024746DB1|nr:cytidine deaminase [Kitasatospora sp. GP82]MDH6126846.1 cytidine deaminase [Kitasatospora sp. GP82]
MALHHRSIDHDLVRAATHTVQQYARGDNHTVAAAARARDGRIITALNAYHFTGGPCAELVLIGTAAAQGAYELDTIVAVGNGGRGVVPPCGRCRQVLFDYFPELDVILGSGADSGTGTDVQLRTVSIAQLLPAAYVWADRRSTPGPSED